MGSRTPVHLFITSAEYLRRVRAKSCTRLPIRSRPPRLSGTVRDTRSVEISLIESPKNGYHFRLKEDHYSAKLNRIKELDKRTERLVLGVIPFMLASGAILAFVLFLFPTLNPLPSSVGELIVKTLLFSYAFVVLISFSERANFQCPRCGKKFFRRGLFHNQFSSSCMNCGLPKNQDETT